MIKKSKTYPRFNTIVGLQVKRIRKAKGLSQNDLADKMNLSRASIVNIEAGRQSLSFLSICRMAEIFHVPVGYFKGDKIEIKVKVTKRIKI